MVVSRLGVDTWMGPVEVRAPRVQTIARDGVDVVNACRHALGVPHVLATAQRNVRGDGCQAVRWIAIGVVVKRNGRWVAIGIGSGKPDRERTVGRFIHRRKLHIIDMEAALLCKLVRIDA